MNDSNRPPDSNPSHQPRRGRRRDQRPFSQSRGPDPKQDPAPRTEFAGDRKADGSILGRFEKKWVRAGIGLIPSSVETHHLTSMTLIWSLGVLYFSWRAVENPHWMWMVSVMIILQYLTDLFDGAVGRERKTGLIKWGFYMDHFLDYVFQAAVIVGYTFLAPPGLELYFMGILALGGGFMVSSFLAFASTNAFKITFVGLGPTEIRVVMVAINAGIVFLGTGLFIYTVPLIFFGMLLSLSSMVYQTQKNLWELDMRQKKKKRFKRPQRQHNQGPASRFPDNRPPKNAR